VDIKVILILRLLYYQIIPFLATSLKTVEMKNLYHGDTPACRQAGKKAENSILTNSNHVLFNHRYTQVNTEKNTIKES